MIYYATLVIFFALGFFNVYSDNQKVINRCFFFAVLWMILLVGLRWQIGSDWEPYYKYFRYCLALKNPNEQFEVGYVAINKFVRFFTDQYNVFLMLHAIIVYGGIAYFIKKYAIFPLLSWTLFFAIMLGYTGMNRQFISIAILLFSITFVIRRQFAPYVVCILASMLFHNSSIMFFPVYFLTKLANRYFYIALVVVLIAISVSGVMNRLPLQLFYLVGSGVGDTADKYLYTQLESVSLASQLVGISKRLLWIAISLIYFDEFKKVKNFPLFFNIYFVAFFVFMLFSSTALNVISSRGILAFNIFEVLILPMILFVFKDNATRKIMLLFILIYCFMLVKKSFDSYLPLMGFDIFNPYRCILFE